jgi:hypothetical protein
MNRILILLSLFLFVTVYDGKSQGELVKPDFIKNHVLANHSKLAGIKGNLTSFKKYLKSLDTSLLSISYSIDYIKTCIPANDSISGDSVFYYFRNKFNSIVNKLSNSLLTEYRAVIKSLGTCKCTFFAEVGEYMAIDSVDLSKDSDPKKSAFVNNLNLCGIYVMGNDMDGNRVDAKTDYFYNNFYNRITNDVRNFLIERQTEISEGFSADGGLTISIDTVYYRTIYWEKFYSAYPNSIFSEESYSYYNTYLVNLLTNFESFEEAYILKPGAKALYEKIIKKHDETKTSQLISDWYTTLSQHAFYANDSLTDAFFKEHNLHRRFGSDPPELWIYTIEK